MVQGGNPAQRPDQLLQSKSRSGVGPAPQQSVFQRLIVDVVPGTGIFLYSPGPGTGNLIGSWTSAAGTDQYGNAYPKGINVTAGVLSNVTVNALTETVNPGPFFLDGPQGLTIQFFNTPGVNNWTAPAGVTSVQAYCWATGGTGGNGAVGTEAGGGGGGGEFAGEATVAVTPATIYHPTIGAVGSPTTFAGDSLTVTAHSGSNGANGTASTPGAGGLGGTGSTNSVHLNGGAGGSGGSPVGSGSSGGGGGSSGSITQTGNAGVVGGGTSGIGGPGGAAIPGYPISGGAGGHGGTHGTNAGVTAGSSPGGGGGGGGDSGTNPGSAGANGQVLLIYSSSATVTTYVALAAASVTDPLTGISFSRGITSFDYAFSDSVNLYGSNVFVVSGINTWQLNSASLDVATVGQGLRVAEGSNAKQGTATLTAGTVTVANTSVTANSRIFLTAQTTGAGPGALRVSARTAGTSFTITSSNAADTSLVAYEIFEPG